MEDRDEAEEDRDEAEEVGDDDPGVMSNTIFRSWVRGMTAEGLSNMFGMSLDTVNETLRAEKEKRPLPSQLRPQEVVRDYRFRLEGLIEDLASVGAKAQGPASIRALQVRFVMLKALFELDQATGVVPQDLRHMVLEIDLDRSVEGILKLLEDRGLLTDDIAVAMKRLPAYCAGHDELSSIPTEEVPVDLLLG